MRFMSQRGRQSGRALVHVAPIDARWPRGSAVETALWADLDDSSDLFGPLVGGAVSPSFLAVERAHTWNHQGILWGMGIHDTNM